jgi:hypothetical protein
VKREILPFTTLRIELSPDLVGKSAKLFYTLERIGEIRRGSTSFTSDST